MCFVCIFEAVYACMHVQAPWCSWCTLVCDHTFAKGTRSVFPQTLTGISHVSMYVLMYRYNIYIYTHTYFEHIFAWQKESKHPTVSWRLAGSAGGLRRGESFRSSVKSRASADSTLTSTQERAVGGCRSYNILWEGVWSCILEYLYQDMHIHVYMYVCIYVYMYIIGICICKCNCICKCICMCIICKICLICIICFFLYIMYFILCIFFLKFCILCIFVYYVYSVYSIYYVNYAYYVGAYYVYVYCVCV